MANKEEGHVYTRQGFAGKYWETKARREKEALKTKSKKTDGKKDKK